MTDYIRRLVSGKKARFKDDELKLELDLVYVTDQIIIMGYPASGFAGYYRNRREDAKKFLDHRHNKNYWVFNFCPLGENSYDPQYFEGRVSRYPFPDHHAPPLAIMPLVAREMRAWLSGSPERVAVLHCKAGKGRSGTMACTYLLSLDEEPAPPKLRRSHTAKEWAKRRAEETMEALPEDKELDQMQATDTPLLEPSSSLTSECDTPNFVDPGEKNGATLVTSPGTMSPPGANPEKSFTDALKGVLELHTSRRMKAPSDPGKKPKQGVSIPSQRRFLYYWALCLAYEAPAGFWSLESPSPPSFNPLGTRTQKYVKITEIKIRLRELSPVKLGLVKAANVVIDKTMGSTNSSQGSKPEANSLTSGAKKQSKSRTSTGPNQVWASLARYDDEFVMMLENWEKYTRSENGNLGIRRPGSEYMNTRGEGEEEERLAAMFSDGRWDKHKMVRSFARLGEVGETTRREAQGIDKEEKTSTYTLRPLTNQSWQDIKKDIIDSSSGQVEQIKTEITAEESDLPASENASMHDSVSRMHMLPGTPSDNANNPPDQVQDQGVILDAEREVRIKLYMGQIFMGWIWLIPAFHMAHPAPTRKTIRLTRKDIDFPIGLGAGIVDVEISLEWVVPSEVHPGRDIPLPETKNGTGTNFDVYTAAEDEVVGENTEL